MVCLKLCIFGSNSVAMKKKSCGFCGKEFMAKGARKHCSDECSSGAKRAYDALLFARMGAMGLGYSRAKANALRNVAVPAGRGAKVSLDWRIKPSDYRLLAGKCFYCGGEGYGLARMDKSGPWSVSNVVCCCGGCGIMRRGLSHEAFLAQIQRIVSKK